MSIIHVNQIKTQALRRFSDLVDLPDLGDCPAGFASIADHINQGMMLNLPCKVITKPSPDGKYMNIERVLPIQPLHTQGRERP